MVREGVCLGASHSWMQQLMCSTSELDEGSQPVELPETSDIPCCWIQRGVRLLGSARQAFRWVFITAVSNPVRCYRSSPCAGKKPHIPSSEEWCLEAGHSRSSNSYFRSVYTVEFLLLISDGHFPFSSLALLWHRAQQKREGGWRLPLRWWGRLSHTQFKASLW